MNPLINLFHLKLFCDAVTYRSVSEAAKMNYITQSAVSQAIGKLEKIFETELITHNRQSLYVTEEGRVLYEQARGIFKAVKSTFDKVSQTKEEISGELKFVTTKSLGMSFIAPTYINIKNELPFVELNFRMGGMNLIRTALRQEEAEFAIVVYDRNFSQFAKYPIKTGRINLYSPKKATKNLIQQGVFVDSLEGMYVKELGEYLSGLDEPIKINSPVAGWELVSRFADLGIGVGFFPDYIVANNRHPSLEVHSLEIPTYEYEICAIYNKSTELSRVALAFLEQFTLEW